MDCWAQQHRLYCCPNPRSLGLHHLQRYGSWWAASQNQAEARMLEMPHSTGAGPPDMTCPNCHFKKPRREFALLRRYTDTRQRYGIWCNECRRGYNRTVSSAVRMTDAYLAWLVRQTSWTDPETASQIAAGKLPELIAARRKQLSRKRLVKGHANTRRFFAAAAASGIIKA